MLPPAAIDAVGLWEQVRMLPPLGQTRALAGAVARGPVEADRVEDEPLGACHARLLALCAMLHGGTLPAEVACPACGAKLEFALAVRDLLAQAPRVQAVEVEAEGRTYTFRVPTLADVEAAARHSEGAQHLLARCLADPPEADVPAGVADRAEALLAEADPLALVRLALACPACAAAWDEALDVRRFALWAVEREAERFVRDVHRLARAYGWTEADVRALGPWRRQQYLAWAEV